MSRRRVDLARARRAAGLTQEELAGRIGVDRSTVGRWEAGSVEPTLWARGELARVLDTTSDELGELLGDVPNADASAPTAPQLVVRDAGDAGDTAGGVTDEIEAFELARRVSASDVGETTLARLEEVVDELAQAYLTVPPQEALARTRGHLRYVKVLLDARKTLEQHRRLLVAGGWLSLLAGTLHIDLEQQAPAIAWIRTARDLADESRHEELCACTVETEAWRALSTGDFPLAARLAQSAQDIAPAGSSAYLQAAAQEGRAQARLNDVGAARAVVGRVGRLAEPMGKPDQPEHHFRYDLVKATTYTATTLTWLGDPAAVEHAREVVRAMAHGGGTGGRVRRLALSRLDLALALLGRGEVEEAAAVATAAMRSRLVRADLWRAREVVTAIEATGSHTTESLQQVYRELLAKQTA